MAQEKGMGSGQIRDALQAGHLAKRPAGHWDGNRQKPWQQPRNGGAMPPSDGGSVAD